MSHDLKQSFTMVVGFIIGLSLAFIIMPSNLALAVTSGIVCGLLAGAFFAQVNYGDVFWHAGHSFGSAEDVKQPLTVPKTSASRAERGRSEKPAQKRHSTSSFSTSRFYAMITGSSARRNNNPHKERSYWTSRQRAQTFIPGRQEQQGRRYQRRVKPREGLRIES